MNTNPPQPHPHTLSQDILERIEREEITPISKSVFTTKNILFWVLWGIAILLGACAVSVVIFAELNIGWEYYEMTHPNAFTFFVESFPLLWLILLSLVVLFAIYNIRHTKHGYRQSLFAIVLIGLGGSALGGFLIHQGGFDADMDDMLGRFVPLYMSVPEARESFWTQPKQGLYTGVIEAVNDAHNEITLRSTDGGTNVFATTFLPMGQRADLEKNVHVRIMATSTDEFSPMVICHVAQWDDGRTNTLELIREKRTALMNAFVDLEEHFFVEDTNPCHDLIRARRGMMMWQ